MADIILTDGNDIQTLSPGELGTGDSLFALRGNDDVTGSSNNETILLGKDNDVARGGGGNDEINGNNEEDVVSGGAGNDTVRGGKASDMVFGGEGNDSVYGDRGADILIGNGGADTFVLFADSTLPPGSTGDQLLDYNPAEGDQIGLIGLTANDITLNPTPGLRSRNVILPLFPPGVGTETILGEFGLTDVLQNSANPTTNLLDGIQIIANGQVLATVYNNVTEADILSGITTVNL